MVDKSVIVSLSISVMICFLIPLGALVYFIKSKNKTVRPFLVGMLVFVVFQMVLRIPILLYVLPNFEWYLKLSTNPWLYGIFLGVTAGIFEEVGRYLGFKYMLIKNHRYIDGISFGFGHGGIEAILITGISVFSTLVMAIMINSGASVPEVLANQITSLSSTQAILGGVERVFAMIIHIGLSVIVLYGIRVKKLRYLGLAILIHTVVNAPIVILLQVFGVGVLGIEFYILICAVVMLLLTFKFKAIYDKEEKLIKREI